MADTLPSIELVSNQWTDIYVVTGIAKGTKIAVQNIGSSDVYLASVLLEPNIESDSFQVIQPNDFPMSNCFGDRGAWALSPNAGAKINVRVVP